MTGLSNLSMAISLIPKRIPRSRGVNTHVLSLENHAKEASVLLFCSKQYTVVTEEVDSSGKCALISWGFQ